MTLHAEFGTQLGKRKQFSKCNGSNIRGPARYYEVLEVHWFSKRGTAIATDMRGEHAKKVCYNQGSEHGPASAS